MHTHFLQHVPFEGLGSIRSWLENGGHSITATRLFAGEPLPDFRTIDWLIVMGGPMGVHDEPQYPWLVEEKRCIENAIAAGKTVLGICLGAQLIAHVLGATVRPNAHREIGWFPLTLSTTGADTAIGQALGEGREVFHWHGDTFELPPGASHIASSVACEQQAFVYDERIVGLQFHLETTHDLARGLIDNCGDELNPGPFVQSASEILRAPQSFAELNAVMGQVLDALAA